MRILPERAGEAMAALRRAGCVLLTLSSFAKNTNVLDEGQKKRGVRTREIGVDKARPLRYDPAFPAGPGLECEAETGSGPPG